MDHVIEARGLAKSFAGAEAVRGVDLTVRAGEIVGFLGPNGAGKTTTLRMLTTLLRPTAGTATVAGHDLIADPAGVRRGIGYVAQGGSTNPSCTALRELVLQARLYRVPDAPARSRDLLAEFDLADRPIGSMSGGQKRRLDIALGVVHRPAVVFLDEPTTGLDPQSRSALWDHVRRLRERHGTTVFLTTHYLEEADALCDRVLIIDQGRVIEEGSPRELKARLGGDVVTIEISGDVPHARSALAGLAAVREVRVTGRTLRLTVAPGDRILIELTRALDAAGVEPLSIRHTRPTLDDVFLALTDRKAAAHAA
ncbi:ATP-binding cassette domain-containing protein [Actinoallomurus spadix]|uniref:ATP-binding cassette domain-containing protein n=1 Tax=Actinoallomurus spadix TaxID=79912 RepID=A0ABN0WPR7_9ACTN|nr:ATP-binding cassette domain-containing protein [Actinoallomurus spadix]MCO5984781.1 ATP-binding cassette domain-containing protein [Actinoallomurus spadix]